MAATSGSGSPETRIDACASQWVRSRKTRATAAVPATFAPSIARSKRPAQKAPSMRRTAAVSPSAASARARRSTRVSTAGSAFRPDAERRTPGRCDLGVDRERRTVDACAPVEYELAVSDPPDAVSAGEAVEVPATDHHPVVPAKAG